MFLYIGTPKTITHKYGFNVLTNVSFKRKLYFIRSFQSISKNYNINTTKSKCIRHFSKKTPEPPKIYNNFTVGRIQPIRNGKIIKSFKIAVAIGFAWLIISDIPFIYRPIKSMYAIAKIFSVYLFFYKLNPFIKTGEEEMALSDCHSRAAEILFLACVELKGIYIKLGQGLSTMHHIVPNEYIRVLTNLKKLTSGRTLRNATETLESELGYEYRDMFVRIAAYSFAAASMASVFAAVLDDDNKSAVALKIQYNEVSRYSEGDLRFIIFALRIIEFWDKDLEFKFIFERLYKSLIDESNFLKEADNLERCKIDLAKFPFVYVPKVYYPITCRRIIGLEFIDGAEITLTRLTNYDLSPKEVMNKILQIFGYQIFESGFVHGDPHHSNLLARKSKKDNQAEIIVIDHGLYTELEEKHRIALAKFWIAGITGDENQMIENANILGVEDFKTLWTMIFQRPYSTDGVSLFALSDREHIIKMTNDYVKRISKILKALPSSILLVLRNLNTIRSLNIELEEPCDFLFEMTKWAKAAIDRPLKNPSFWQRLTQFFHNFILRIYILKEDILRRIYGRVAKNYNIDEILIEI